MAKDKNGWYALQRSIQDGDIWNLDEPFGKRAAYIDLLLMANYEEKNFVPRHSNDVIVIHVGELPTSIRTLMRRWKWGERKVSAYLHQLEMLGLVRIKAYSWGTLLTLVEYSESGNGRNTNDNTNDNRNDNAYDNTNSKAVDNANDNRNDGRLKKDKNRNNNNKDKEIKQSAKRSGVYLWEGEPE